MRNWILFLSCTLMTSPAAIAQIDYRVGDVPAFPNLDKPTATTTTQASDLAGRDYLPPLSIPMVPAPDSPEAGARLTESIESLDELLAIACASNPTIKQANAHITAEMGKAIQAGLYPNPVVRYSAEQIGVNGTPGEFHGGIISQEIVRGGKLRLSRAKYHQRVRVAEAQAVAQQFRVCNDVSIQYYKCLAVQQQIEIQTEIVKSIEDHAVTVREAYQMGQANNAAMRKSNVELRQSHLKLLSLQNEAVQCIRTLSALVGTELTQVQGPLEGTPASIGYDELLASLYENSPQLLAAKSKLEGDRITIEREKAEPIPNLNLEGGAGYNFDSRETVAVAGVSFKLPIFDRNQGTVQQARADMARQCAEIARIQASLKQELSIQYQNHQTSSQYLLQFRDHILPELRESYRLTLESYKANRETWENVLVSQQDYFQARLEYINWLTRWRHAEVLLDGMLLSGGLAAAENPTPAGHVDSVPKPR